MGKRGPPPEPSILKYIRGNPSKEKLNDAEPTPDLAMPTLQPPEYLDGDALRKWQHVVPVLARSRVMTEADAETIGRYCALWAEWKKNYEIVKQNGDVFTIFENDPDSPGKRRVKYMQSTPYAVHMAKLAVLLLRIEQEFGLTPSSRSQVTIHASPDDDPVAAYVKKRGDRAGA